jgi:hypothetical protein
MVSCRTGYRGSGYRYAIYPRLQMLMPLSAKCSWKRRISFGVAASGDRFRTAANRLQLWMWPLPAVFTRIDHPASYGTCCLQPYLVFAQIEWRVPR